MELFVKRKNDTAKKAKIYYARVDELWRKEQKYDFLNEKEYVDNVKWQEISPDSKHNWMTEGMDSSFDSFISLGTKESKSSKDTNVESVF